MNKLRVIFSAVFLLLGISFSYKYLSSENDLLLFLLSIVLIFMGIILLFGKIKKEKENEPKFRKR